MLDSFPVKLLFFRKKRLPVLPLFLLKILNIDRSIYLLGSDIIGNKGNLVEGSFTIEDCIDRGLQ